MAVSLLLDIILSSPYDSAAQARLLLCSSLLLRCWNHPVPHIRAPLAAQCPGPCRSRQPVHACHSTTSLPCMGCMRAGALGLGAVPLAAQDQVAGDAHGALAPAAQRHTGRLRQAPARLCGCGAALFAPPGDPQLCARPHCLTYQRLAGACQRTVRSWAVQDCLLRHVA